MASRRKNQQVVSALDSSEAFSRAITESEKFLVIIDIHQGWDPIYRKTYIELDRADERLKFYTIDESKLLPEQRVGLPLSDSCRPLFVVYKDKVPINKVLGVNAPELELVIADNVPPVPRDEE